jgi:hypothetical protein
VFATPAVFINGVQVFGWNPTGQHAEGDLADMTTSDWKKLLDPLMGASKYDL